VEIMGRDAGWLTASASLPRIISGYGPDYVYLPEVPFSTEVFLSNVRAALKKHSNVVVAVSEGIRFADGSYVGESAQNGVADVFGHKYLAGTGTVLESIVKNEIGCKVRSICLNLPQRCAAHCASLVDLEESSGVGVAATEAASSGVSGCMMSMQRCEGAYAVWYKAVPISEIANRMRGVPREMIDSAGTNVTDECLQYILPLIQGEPKLRYENGIPVQLVIQ